MLQGNTYTKKPSIGDQPTGNSFSLRGKPSVWRPSRRICVNLTIILILIY